MSPRRFLQTLCFITNKRSTMEVSTTQKDNALTLTSENDVMTLSHTGRPVSSHSVSHITNPHSFKTSDALISFYTTGDSNSMSTSVVQDLSVIEHISGSGETTTKHLVFSDTPPLVTTTIYYTSSTEPTGLLPLLSLHTQRWVQQKGVTSLQLGSVTQNT